MIANIFYRSTAEHFTITGWGMVVIVLVVAVQVTRWHRKRLRIAKINAKADGWIDGYTEANDRFTKALRTANAMDMAKYTVDGTIMSSDEYRKVLSRAIMEGYYQ